MNNEPVAWIDKNTGKPKMEGFIKTDYDIPLYTHPAKTLTDEEIIAICDEFGVIVADTGLKAIRAILRKASE